MDAMNATDHPIIFEAPENAGPLARACGHTVDLLTTWFSEEQLQAKRAYFAALPCPACASKTKPSGR